ncbi:MAG: DNA-directed RNA polymerase subunit K [Candidatus Argoarchaeum ethanivorans]|uniref:DNA-directed RNA polymerase subunit Rpo6 n=1 Tax=Candidatus Argoarchaeum ethanivorans TaxID=2608793 RepID=A0A8B3S2N2_9EURY|nr:MAG: DNA-directed RNA polymerase subunit K [Candidatus Argoarchaeum ethanivorans]
MEIDKYTRYERARIVGARALQISMGAPVLIPDAKGEPIDIAIEELRLGAIPITAKHEHRVYKIITKSMVEEPEIKKDEAI